MADSSDWEERLDIDDSDLFAIGIAPSLPSCPLRPCSSSRSTNPSSVSPRLLPGPAGAVQAAMHRIKRRNVGEQEKEKGSQGDDIGRVGGPMVLDGEVDADFQLDSWIYAMQYLGTKSNWVTPIGSIRTDSICRIPMMVGLVKSCTPNGLGDLVLTLKDQTGAISASIHNKALLEGTLGSDVAVGCVLILKQVVVFSPVRAIHYLNITEDNVVKLVGKNCGDSQELIMASLATELQENSPAGLDETGFTWFQVIAGKREKNKQMEQHLVNGLENHAQVRASAIQETRSDKVDSCMSRLNPKVDEASGMCTNLTRTCEQSQNSQNILRKISGDTLFCKTSRQNKSVFIRKDNLEPNKGNEEKEKLASKVLIPEWTDEQLSELFADY